MSYGSDYKQCDYCMEWTNVFDDCNSTVLTFEQVEKKYTLARGHSLKSNLDYRLYSCFHCGEDLLFLPIYPD